MLGGWWWSWKSATSITCTIEHSIRIHTPAWLEGRSPCYVPLLYNTVAVNKMQPHYNTVRVSKIKLLYNTVIVAI